MTVTTTGATKARSYSGDYMQVGKRAESIVLAFLQQRPDVIGVSDYRDLKPVQEADIDFGIQLRDGLVALAEVKSDRHLNPPYGNVLFEVLRINHTCTPERACVLGWAARTPAQYLMYYAPQQERIYITQFHALRRAFQNYTGDTRKGMRLSVVETDAIKTTVNVLIPWGYCAGIFTAYDVAEYA